MDIGTKLAHEIFNCSVDFDTICLEVFRFQYQHNSIYKKYINALGIDVAAVRELSKIPFLPIRFFKTHDVTATTFEAEVIFESSGTTETINSRHYVKAKNIYEQSFLSAFEQFYGDPSEWCVLGLLPSYLERQHSSLVYMVEELVKRSGHERSGFYLYDFEKLYESLQALERAGQKTLLIGVTFGLLDFVEKHQLPLRHTVVMETGGMKGRRKEMIRQEVHDVLKRAFALKEVHSEYGMTELLSQAYSKGDGLFRTPGWMRILLRDEEDPLTIKAINDADSIRGLINVIDLANIYSCSFIATDDLGILHNNGQFEITGRMDHSDLRGCSLLVV
ncbi:acyl transferase [Niabella yanshanensis]|uniref:Acyl transferase n=1 Tax=Niabella yanshanensis TaxID=577386 RepID=A0ABZ0W2I3_9BACT|nr:acyl transferase [Niabella yanshanensis]WQD37321.1 acyl transferase [Niabella yanshanensis]